MSKEKAKNLLEFYLPDFENKHEVEIFTEHIPAGFPSPAEDFLEKRLDLNDYLINNRSATFLVRVTGNSMEKAGISDGDILVVDRSAEPTDGKVVLCVLNGEFTVKRISKNKDKLFLVPANDQYPPIEVKPEMDFRIWGVVTYSIHKI